MARLVIAASKPWTCLGCQVDFGAGEFLAMEDAGPHCLDCADLAHLEFMPVGNAALTRRAKRGSRLSAVVVLEPGSQTPRAPGRGRRAIHRRTQRRAAPTRGDVDLDLSIA
jgi:hypothetical protein